MTAVFCHEIDLYIRHLLDPHHESYLMGREPASDGVHNVMHGFVHRLALRPAAFKLWTVDNITPIFWIWLNDNRKSPGSYHTRLFFWHINIPLDK